MIRNKTLLKSISMFLILNMLFTLFTPNVSYALTGGPNSPEYASFEPVATTNMVDPFTGNFTYNLPVLQIPGPDGGGYAMSLSYHSGVTPEEEASWVGFGWTLNPGAVNRDVRGFPDDYNNVDVDFYNKARPSWTVGSTLKAHLEFFSQEERDNAAKDSSYSPASRFTSLDLSTSLRYNNYQGFTRSYSFGPSFKGYGSLGMNISSSGITFSANLNPLAFLNLQQKKQEKARKRAEEKYKTDETQDAATKKQVLKDRQRYMKKHSRAFLSGGSGYGLHMFADAAQSVSVSQYRGYTMNVSLGLQGNPTQAPVGVEGGHHGSFTMQFNEPKTTRKAYGYMYSPGINRVDDGDVMGDYATEKDNPYSRREYFLGIPFSNPDNFNLSGEGLSGGFRAYLPETGHYYPNFVSSNAQIYGIGVEVMLGTNVGVGVNLSFGNQNNRSRDWRNPGNAKQFGTTPSVLRFMGDMGDELNYGDNSLTEAKVFANPDFPGIKGASPLFTPGAVYPNLNNASSATDVATNLGRTSFINPTMSGSKVDKMSIHNEDGMRYDYTLPIYTRNVSNISVDAHPSGDVRDNYLVYKDLMLNSSYNVEDCQHNMVMGDVKKESYASAYLLEAITTPDYIDANGNGPDESDFGGWTKFEYHKRYGSGSSNGWYRYRIPYTGLLYNKGQISEYKDDMGSVVTGEKEVHYLKKVETKTHIAYFVTNVSDASRFDLTANGMADAAPYLLGTMSVRNDGLGASALLAFDPAANDDANKNNTATLEYLEKIVLFAKDRPDKPLQITNFQYDYTLVPNLPNNIEGNFPGNDPNSQLSGKLTLRKVWTEYEGVVNARISSYEFNYRYKNRADYPQELISDNPHLNTFFDLSNRYSVNAQNPAYNPHHLDEWGNIQIFGEERHETMMPWLYQGDIPTSEQFDPAAWQLKQIKLPSGGEILIEYEQKDYSFVQDRNPMLMASILDFNDDHNNKNPWYDIDVSDMGYTYGSSEDQDAIIELADMMHKEYVLDSNRMYFKFLYALEGNTPDMNNCRSEYITGYAKVKEVQYPSSTGKIRIILDGEGSGYEEDFGYSMTPRQGCYDFYSTNRVGKFDYGCVGGYYEVLYENTINGLAENTYCGGGFLSGLGNILAKFGFAVAAIEHMALNSIPDFSIQPPLKSNVCLTIDNEHSYLKIPMNKAKRGGGIRVKRLMMYDSGIEQGDAAIYGSEYHYVLPDGSSSGVATTEPGEMREENPLVGFVPRKSQTWLSRHIIGNDKEQSEGPYGETILPGASVGHSRVVVTNVYTGRTGTGFSVNEYYTVKDYPFDKSYNYGIYAENVDRQFDIAEAGGVRGVEATNLASNTVRDKMVIPTGIFNYSSDKVWAAQGYRFIINQMHGQPKSMKTYGGDIENPALAGIEDKFLVSGQEFEYYQPGERVRLMQPDGTYQWKVPGKEMDVTQEMRSMNDWTLDFGFEVDVSAGLFVPPPIFVTGSLSFSFDEKVISTHVTSKVIRYPAIQKRVTTYNDGIKAISENLAFDHGTGRPILTRTTDAFHTVVNDFNRTSGQIEKQAPHDGSIYNLNLPAHWYYTAALSGNNGMGSKVENIDNTNQLNAFAGTVVCYGIDANPLNGGDTWSIKTDRVISSSVNTFNTSQNYSQWFTTAIHNEYGSAAIAAQLGRIWRPHKSYVYKEDVLNSSNPPIADNSSRIFTGGTYNVFTPFNFLSEYGGGAQTDNNWIELNEVTLYSPHGNALEERNVLDIFSSAKFGFDFTQPIMITQNGRYTTTFFEHYEDLTPNNMAHSGQVSLEVSNTSTVDLVTGLVADDQLAEEGGWLKLWINHSSDFTTLQAKVGSNTFPLEKVARVGEWELYRVLIPSTSFTSGTAFTVQLTHMGGGTVYVDDVRFQPRNAQAICYVYDKRSLRLITQFDDQHFGLYYQYNGEGKLVRRLKETERGMKLIDETQYNTPGELRQ